MFTTIRIPRLARFAAWSKALILLLCLCVCASAYANVVYVKPTGLDTNSGVSWALAKKTVAAGIIAANVSGDEVWVAAGTYVENLTLTPTGKALYGGFAGNETLRTQRNWTANPTILAKTGNVVSSAVTGAVLDGFTVRDGGNTGLGVSVTSGTATIANCTISGNSCGVEVIGGTAAIANCTITANSTGVYLSIGTANVSNCTISGNVNYGLYALSGGTANVSNCTISGNTTYGLLVESATCTVVNCAISGNTDAGVNVSGDLPAITITNCTISGNSHYGLYADYNGTANVSNCIVANNATGINWVSGTLTLSHNDVWGNAIANYVNIAADTGSISADPKFVNQAGGDYHLLAGSPCIDAGDDAAGIGATDLDGNPRKQGAHVDMGATEYFAYVLATYPGRTLTSPTASADGIVYFGDSAGFLHSINTATRVAVFNIDIKIAAPANSSRKALGRLTRWNLGSTPRIFCVTSDNYLMVYALDGTPVWTAQLGTTGTSVIGSAMVFKDSTNDFVYVATSDGTNTVVSKLTATGGIAHAPIPFPGAAATSSVSVYGDSVFLSTSAGSYCLAASDLTVKAGLSAIGTAPPFIAATGSSPVAIVVTTDGFVKAYSPFTGAAIDTFGSSGSVDLGITVASGPKVTAAPFVYNAKIYVGGMDNKVYCLNLADGTPAGTGGTKVFYNATASGAGAITAGVGVCPYSPGTLVFGSTNGNYYAVNLSGTGGRMIAIGSAINTAPAYDPATNTISIAADDGNMYQMPAG